VGDRWSNELNNDPNGRAFGVELVVLLNFLLLNCVEAPNEKFHIKPVQQIVEELWSGYP
jgi:hypothetical protein